MFLNHFLNFRHFKQLKATKKSRVQLNNNCVERFCYYWLVLQNEWPLNVWMFVGCYVFLLAVGWIIIVLFLGLVAVVFFVFFSYIFKLFVAVIIGRYYFEVFMLLLVDLCTYGFKFYIYILYISFFTISFSHSLHFIFGLF